MPQWKINFFFLSLFLFPSLLPSPTPFKLLFLWLLKQDAEIPDYLSSFLIRVIENYKYASKLSFKCISAILRSCIFTVIQVKIFSNSSVIYSLIYCLFISLLFNYQNTGVFLDIILLLGFNFLSTLTRKMHFVLFQCL